MKQLLLISNTGGPSISDGPGIGSGGSLLTTPVALRMVSADFFDIVFVRRSGFLTKLSFIEIFLSLGTN